MKCPHHPWHDLNPESGICALCAADLPVDDRASASNPVEEDVTDGDRAAMGSGATVDEPAEPTDSPDRAKSGEPSEPPAIALVTRAQRAAEGKPGTRADPKAAGGGIDETPEAQFFADLKNIKKQKLPAVLFFGFRTAGKTWLLDRMKHELVHGQGINCLPPFKPIEADSKKLPGSSEIEFHRVLAPPRPFVLIDIPGEPAEDLVNGKLDDLNMLLAAMDYADAMIIALPCDIVLFGDLLPTTDDELLALARPPRKGAANDDDTMSQLKALIEAMRLDNTKLDQFTTGLFLAVGILSYLRKTGIDLSDKDEFAKLDIADIMNHMTDTSNGQMTGSLDIPTFFALTKADRVLALLPDPPDNPVIAARNRDIRGRPEALVFGRLLKQLKDYRIVSDLTDPWEDVQKSRTTLHGQLLNNFPLGKFDYVSAFYGHTGSEYLARDHYRRHPERGVLAVLLWIRKAQRLGRRGRLRRLPYSLAARARRYLARVAPPERFDMIGRNEK